MEGDGGGQDQRPSCLQVPVVASWPAHVSLPASQFVISNPSNSLYTVNTLSRHSLALVGRILLGLFPLTTSSPHPSPIASPPPPIMAAVLPYRDINVHSSPSHYAFSSPSSPSAPTLVVDRPSGDLRLHDGKLLGSKRVSSIAGILGIIKLRLGRALFRRLCPQPQADRVL